MKSSSAASLDVDNLMARIRAEVARRKLANPPQMAAPSVDKPDSSTAPIVLDPLPLPELPKAQFVPAERFALNDFLALHDQDFIQAAYRGLLKRDPDDTGSAYFLSALRNGALSKPEILGRLRYSPEGRRLRVPVRGLLITFAVQHLYRLPVVGGVVAFAAALMRLPRIVRNQQGLEGYQHQRNAELESAIRNIALAGNLNQRSIQASVAHAANDSLQVVRQHDAALAQLSAQIDAAKIAAQERARQFRDQIDSAQQQLAAVAEWHEQSRQWQADAVARVDALDRRIAMSEAQQAAAAKRIEAVETQSTVAANMMAAAALREETLVQRIAASESREEAFSKRIAATELRGDIAEGRMAAVESHKHDIDRQLADIISLSQQASTQLAATLHDMLGVLEQRVESLGGAVKSEQQDALALRMRLIERVARIEGRVQDEAARLVGQAAAVGGVSSTDKVASAPHDSSRFDKLYFAFEQRFRGSREDIRERLRYYLPMLHESVVGKENASVLDIGCGRGEWLELLRDENLHARGVDINATMASECIERGLEVISGDAIALLKQLPDNALGALTGFHIIEHISLDTLLELIEQAHRVVQPGGLVIFETPNPENVIVGSCNFYMDPTHQRPLPPPLMQFMLEAGGLVDVAIHRVNAHLLPKIFDEADAADPPALRTALTFLRSEFSCAPDYSVIGRVA